MEDRRYGDVGGSVSPFGPPRRMVERARAKAIRQKEIDEEKAREENLEHKTKIYQELINALFPYIDNNKQAIIKTKNIIAGIAQGKIPYISIKF